MKKLLSSVIVFIAVLVIFYIMARGVEQQKAKCLEWKLQANAIGMDWTAPDWQVQLCERHNVQLP